jgi:hypothetical protein
MTSGNVYKINLVVETWRKIWPETFPALKLDELSGHCIRWKTTQNRRSLKMIPPECFIATAGRPTIVVRDPFLDWWGKWCAEGSVIDRTLPLRRQARTNHLQSVLRRARGER